MIRKDLYRKARRKKRYENSITLMEVGAIMGCYPTGFKVGEFVAINKTKYYIIEG